MGSGYELARAIQKCISEGHGVDRVWGYTPRQLAGWVQIIDRERVGRNLDLMNAMRSAQLDRKDYKEIAGKMAKHAE